MAKTTTKSFYAVRAGRKVGIYKTWDDCKRQVNGHPGAKFKGFSTLEEAQQYMNEGQASTRAWPVTQEAEPESEPDSKCKAPQATPTPTFRGLRGAAADATPKITINGLRLTQATPSPRLQVGGHHRIDALKKEATETGIEGCYFEKFSSQEQKFKPDVKAEFNQEFDRLASSQGWVPGSQQYRRQRVTALSSEVWTHFFRDALKESTGERLVKREESDAYTESIRKLRGFQALCRAVKKEPGETLEQCKMILKGTLVNIIDLINTSRTSKSLEVWTDFEEFRWYTLSDRAKTIPVEEAKEHEVLKCFLQVFSAGGQDLYEGLCAKLRVLQLGLPLRRATGPSSTSRWTSPSESEDTSSRSPTATPLPVLKVEAVEDMHIKTEFSPSRGRAVVSHEQDKESFAAKRERSESPVFLYERPCKKRVVTPALAKDIKSSLNEWSSFCLTQEPDW